MEDCLVVISINSEIAEYTDIVIQCPKDPEPGIILWIITRDKEAFPDIICVRTPADDECLGGGLQSPHYKNRVTKVTRTSMKVSSVFLNEAGTYHCNDVTSDYLTYTNVRIVSKFAT